MTSKILVNDFLSQSMWMETDASLIGIIEGTVPAKLITGLIILHAER